MLERGRLEDVFWARPLKIGHSKLNTCDVCSIEAHLEVFSGCVPEETHIDADYLTLTLENNSKLVRQISVYALTVRLSPWVSDLVHEVSERQQHLRSKEETEREYVKSDCADMHLSSDDTKIYSFKP